MDFGISAASYPKTKSYLRALPEGCASHPHCAMTPDFLLLLWPDVAPLLKETSLPEGLRARLDVPHKSGTWIPATSMVLCALLLRDRVLKDDAQWASYMFERGREIYKHPLYKAMMFVLSPSLVVMGASKRWQSFYRGTQLETVRLNKTDAALKLTYPEALFPQDYLVALGNLFCAAVACAGARSADYTITNTTSTDADYSLRWS